METIAYASKLTDKLLTEAEARALAIAAQGGDERARERLIKSNLKLVLKIANGFDRGKRGRRLQDLVQEGNIGLLRAIEAYDPARPVMKDGKETDKLVAFTTCAQWWIRAYILRYIVNDHSIVKLGTNARQRKAFFRIRKTRDAIIASGGTGTAAEIAAVLDLPEDLVTTMQARMADGTSLDTPINTEDATTRGDMVESDMPTPDAALVDADNHANIRERMEWFKATLKDPREIAIVERHLMADEPEALAELAREFGCSRERMSQLCKAMIKDLQVKLADLA